MRRPSNLNQLKPGNLNQLKQDITFNEAVPRAYQTMSALMNYIRTVQVYALALAFALVEFSNCSALYRFRVRVQV